MSIGDLTKILLALALIWFGWQFADPYWDKYWFTKEVEKAATYGAKKKDMDAVRTLLTDAFQGRDIQKTGQDCFVNNDDRGFVTIKCEYDAKVELFGNLLHTYHMKIEVSKKPEINKFLN